MNAANMNPATAQAFEGMMQQKQASPPAPRLPASLHPALTCASLPPDEGLYEPLQQPRRAVFPLLLPGFHLKGTLVKGGQSTSSPLLAQVTHR